MLSLRQQSGHARVCEVG